MLNSATLLFLSYIMNKLIYSTNILKKIYKSTHFFPMNSNLFLIPCCQYILYISAIVSKYKFLILVIKTFFIIDM